MSGDRVCAQCDGLLPAGADSRRRFCADCNRARRSREQARLRAQRERLCEQCGRLLPSGAPQNQRFCADCRRERNRDSQRRFRDAHRERLLAADRAYREANRERLAERNRRYRDENRERLRESERARHRANREKHREAVRRYRQAHPERTRAQARSYRRARDHGLTRERFAELLAAQDGRCALCNVKATAERRAFYVDHDATLGCHPDGGSCDRCRRGLLCFFCHFALAWFGENEGGRLERALAYVTQHQTSEQECA